MRLVLVTRRFWPLVGGAEIVMANLALFFQEQGLEVHLLTARWEPNWPAEFRHRNVPVTRLPQPKARGWGTIWYMRALGKWLTEQRESYDLVLVSMLKLDAYAAIQNQHRHGRPVVVRTEGGGVTGDCHWQETATLGKRVRRVTRHANQVIAPSETIHQELLHSGYGASQVTTIPNGVVVPHAAEPDRKAQARANLGDVHGILEVAPLAPLVVYTGRLHSGKGLMDLVHAWPKIVARWGNAKLWLVGEGEQAPELWDTIRQLGLIHSVIMPGCFDDIGEVLEAADVFVLPSYEEGLSLSLLEAMAAGTPVVATDIPGNRQLIEHESNGYLTPAGNVEVLAETLLEVLQSPAAARLCARRARQVVEQNYSLARMGHRHLDVFRRCLEQWKDLNR